MIRLLESQCQYCYKFRGFCILAYHRILDRGCPPILLHHSFPLIKITFSWGGPGGLPLVISLSPLASIYKTSKQIFTPHLSLSPFVSLPGGVPQSYSITLLLTAITIPWGVQGVSPWLFLSISCINLQNLNRDIHTPFFPLPLSIPPWGASPQS